MQKLLTIEQDRVLKKGDKVLVFFKSVKSIKRVAGGTRLAFLGYDLVVQEPLEEICGANVVGDSNTAPE